MSLFDEKGLRSLIEEAVEKGVSRALRTSESITNVGNWVSTAYLGKRYSVAQSTIRRWIREGKIEAKRAGKVLRVNLESFERFLAGSDAPTESASSPEEIADRDEMRERRDRRTKRV